MITSAKNPRIVEARKLDQRKHRLKQNKFLVEGLQILSLAVEAAAKTGRVKPLEVFYSEDLFTGDTAPRLAKELIALGAQDIPVAPNVLDTLSGRDTSQGIAATFALNQLEWSLEELRQLPAKEDASLVLILDKLQDPGNLGTLIRTADAVGVQAIILLEPCVDPFDPKTVRGTMGSLFTVPFSRSKDIVEVAVQLSEMGYRLVGADAPRGETAWQSSALQGSVALVLGNEARGLSQELHDHMADYVSLPLIGQAESLNVSVAGGVLMYEWLRINDRSS